MRGGLRTGLQVVRHFLRTAMRLVVLVNDVHVVPRVNLKEQHHVRIGPAVVRREEYRPRWIVGGDLSVYVPFLIPVLEYLADVPAELGPDLLITHFWRHTGQHR